MGDTSPSADVLEGSRLRRLSMSFSPRDDVPLLSKEDLEEEEEEDVVQEAKGGDASEEADQQSTKPPFEQLLDVVRWVGENPDQPLSLEEAVSMLSSIAYGIMSDDSGSGKITSYTLKTQHAQLMDAGVCAAIAVVMERAVEFSEVQECACGAIWSLAFEPENEAKLLDAGVVPHILAGLRQHKADHNVMERAFGALAALSCSEKGQKIVGESEGPAMGIATLRGLRDPLPRVQRWICALLANVSDNHKDNQARLAKFDAVQWVLRCVGSLLDIKGETRPADIEAFTFASMALEKLMQHPANRAAFLAHKGPAAVAAMMNKLPSILAVQDYCCGVFAQVAQGSDRDARGKEVEVLRKADVEKLLTNAMSNHPSDSGLHAKARRGLSLLSSSVVSQWTHWLRAVVNDLGGGNSVSAGHAPPSS